MDSFTSISSSSYRTADRFPKHTANKCPFCSLSESPPVGELGESRPVGELSESPPEGPLGESPPVGELGESRPVGELSESPPVGELGESPPVGGLRCRENASGRWQWCKDAMLLLMLSRCLTLGHGARRMACTNEDWA